MYRFKDGKYISTPESAGSVILTHAKVEDSGRYYCKVTNSQAGSATSRTATVIVGKLGSCDYCIRKDNDTQLTAWNECLYTFVLRLTCTCTCIMYMYL